MAARSGVKYALNGIKTELTAHLPTYITEIETAETITIPDADAFVVTKREPEHTGDPIVTVSVEGTVENTWYISPLATCDLEIPLLVRVFQRVRETDQDADILAEHYCDAVAQVLAGEVQNEVTGLWRVHNISTSYDYYGGGKHGRVSEVRADITFRTTRAT